MIVRRAPSLVPSDPFIKAPAVAGLSVYGREVPLQSRRRASSPAPTLGRCTGAIHSGRRRTQPSGAGMSTSSSKHNLAARMAVWSGRHRKKAFWGWLAFVVAVFLAGNMVGTTQISDVDQFSGESHRAEVALDRAGLRPVKESVFIQSDKLTVKDPAFRAAVGDVTDRLSKVPYVRGVKSPLTGDSAVSADGHAALVDFEIAGDSTEAADRVDPTLAAVAAAQASHPSLDIKQLGDA